MERIGSRIRRIRVDLAGDQIMARFRSVVEEIGIKPPGMAATARVTGDDHAVHIDEAPVAIAEPSEVRTFVSGVLVEGQERILLMSS